MDPQHTLLFVDDEPGFVTLMRKVFERWSEGRYRVLGATRVGEAMTLMDVNTVHAVVIDLRMPVIDGLQWLKLLHRQKPSLLKVVLSGELNPEMSERCLNAGACLVLEKPRSQQEFDTLCSAVATVVEARNGSGFSGMMREVTLPEVVQMECVGGKTCILHVQAGETAGEILFENGRVVHAETGALFGNDAFYELLTLDGGEFHYRPFREPRVRTVTLSWEKLLLEAAYRRDQAAAGLAASPIAAVSKYESEVKKTRRLMATALIRLNGGGTPVPPPPRPSAPTEAPLARPAALPPAPDPFPPRPVHSSAPFRLSNAPEGVASAAPAPTASAEPASPAAPEPPPQSAAVTPAPRAEPREFIVCDHNGDILMGAEGVDADLRAIFLDFLAAKSAAVERALPALGSGVRIEVTGVAETMVAKCATPEKPGFVAVDDRSGLDCPALFDYARAHLPSVS